MRKEYNLLYDLSATNTLICQQMQLHGINNASTRSRDGRMRNRREGRTGECEAIKCGVGWQRKWKGKGSETE